MPVCCSSRIMYLNLNVSSRRAMEQWRFARIAYHLSCGIVDSCWRLSIMMDNLPPRMASVVVLFPMIRCKCWACIPCSTGFSLYSLQVSYLHQSYLQQPQSPLDSCSSTCSTNVFLSLNSEDSGEGVIGGGDGGSVPGGGVGGSTGGACC